jgi:hypothetical protein
VHTWRITFRPDPGSRRLVADVDAEYLEHERSARAWCSGAPSWSSAVRSRSSCGGSAGTRPPSSGHADARRRHDVTP